MVEDPGITVRWEPHPGGVPQSGSMSSTYLSLNVHVVFATKHRVPSISAEWRSELHAYTAETVRGLACQTSAVGGVKDHIIFSWRFEPLILFRT